MLRIAKREELNKKQIILLRIMAIFSALFVSSVFLLFLKHNPFIVFSAMLKGCFGSLYRFKETINTTIPLVITSLGIMIAFKMKFWNIGAEGQIFMGAFAATYFALNFPQLPKPILLILMAVSAIVAGGMWLLIPALFKAQFGTNETLFTLMLNYIALKWITYLQYSLWRDPEAMGFPKIPNYTENAILPNFLGIHSGWLIALALVIVVYIIMNHTKIGYEIEVIGESENTAKYAGINIKRTIIKAMFIGGGICGLVGMIQASAISGTLTVEVTGGVGYTAIITAWLSGLSAPVAIITSFLFAILTQGGAFIQTAFRIPAAVAQILQALILFFVLASEFAIKYKFVYQSKSKANKEVS